MKMRSVVALLPTGLARRLARAFVGLVAAALLVNGAINMWIAYDEATTSAVGVQKEKAVAAAEKVAQFVGEIESQIGWTTRAEWARVSVDQRRYDFIRLLRQAPAVTEVTYIDGAGKEQLRLSRLEPDVAGSGVDLSGDPRFVRAVADRIWYGPVYFRRGSEPYMTLSVAHAGRNPGVTSVGINLKLIWDVITAIRVGEQGYAYVTDASGRLIAHPDMSLVLRETDLSRLRHVADAVRSAGLPTSRAEPQTVIGLDGRSVLSAHSAISRLGWHVFVELPRREALAPVWTTLYQTIALLTFSTALALLLGSWLARRLAAPIQLLQSGAERLGEGDLTQRVPVASQDEIGRLAERFNVMASRIQEAQETLEQKVDDRTRELGEALAYQTASANVLSVISRSPSKVQPVLDAIISTAADLCEAEFAFIARPDGNSLKLSAGNNMNHVHSQWFAANPIPIDHTTIAGRVAATRQQLHVRDVLADPEFKRLDWQEVGKQRTVLGVPLLRDDMLLGVIILARTIVKPFSDKQVELVSTFADQAVIAIENARLFEELQARTTELSHSLEDLRAAQDRLVQTEKLASLGQLTAGIAHEIKNPLNFVNNFSELSVELIEELEAALAKADKTLDPALRAETSEIAEMLKSNLGKVVQHGKRADSIVKNMLAHSRKGGSEKRAVDLNATVDEALNLAYHGARAEKPGFNVTLVRDYDGGVGSVELYPQEFTRVLLNLIGNGFHAAHSKVGDYAGSGSNGFQPELKVSTRALVNRIEIKIRDNGTGIPDAVKGHIFEPFFTTKPTGEGTGLGLSLSHDIVVKQHGGSLDMATVPGEFTEFTVALPRGGTSVGSVS